MVGLAVVVVCVHTAATAQHREHTRRHTTLAHPQLAGKAAKLVATIAVRRRLGARQRLAAAEERRKRVGPRLGLRRVEPDERERLVRDGDDARRGQGLDLGAREARARDGARRRARAVLDGQRAQREVVKPVVRGKGGGW